MHVSLALVRNVQLLAVEPPHDVSMVRFIETALLKLITRRLTTCSVIICSVIQKQRGVSAKAEKESIQSVEEITFVCAYTALNLSNYHNFPLPETIALVRALRAGSASFLSQGRNHCYRYAYLYLESVVLQDYLVKMASVTEMGNSRLECVGYNILLCTLWGSTPLEKLLGIRGWF